MYPIYSLKKRYKSYWEFLVIRTMPLLTTLSSTPFHSYTCASWYQRKNSYLVVFHTILVPPSYTCASTNHSTAPLQQGQPLLHFLLMIAHLQQPNHHWLHLEERKEWPRLRASSLLPKSHFFDALPPSTLAICSSTKQSPKIFTDHITAALLPSTQRWCQPKLPFSL